MIEAGIWVTSEQSMDHTLKAVLPLF